MEILGKKTRLLLVLLLTAILAATAVTFAVCSATPTAQAATLNLTDYGNAQIGDIVTFGNYYQDADGTTKTPIEWLVVDKDVVSGQLTLLAKHILAGGAYWGTDFFDQSNGSGHSAAVGASPGNILFNQSWADSTVRAWLNNLERTDSHGDVFTTSGINIYADKVKPSKVMGINGQTVQYEYQHSDLKKSVGFSNKNFWTGLKSSAITGTMPAGYHIRPDADEIYYKRPYNTERPAVNGFLDEAFTSEEQSRIIPRVIPGQIGHQWPNYNHTTSYKVHTPATIDKIWIPSMAEMNIEHGVDWNNQGTSDIGDNNWSASTDSSSGDAFGYFRQYSNDELKTALIATNTDFDRNPRLGNFSIPLDVESTNIGDMNTQGSTRFYWLRTPSSYWCHAVGAVTPEGGFNFYDTQNASVGVRPALILSYK